MPKQQKNRKVRELQTENYFSLSQDGEDIICKTITTRVLSRQIFEENLRKRKVDCLFQTDPTQDSEEGE